MQLIQSQSLNKIYLKKKVKKLKLKSKKNSEKSHTNKKGKGRLAGPKPTE